MDLSDSSEQSNFEITISRHLPVWLAENQISLAFATPPSKLFLIGLRPDGQLSVFERSFNKTMGIAKSGTHTIYLGTRYQIWRFENPLQAGQLAEDEYDRLYIPRRAFTTGMVNVHDVAVDAQARIIFVNTRFGCLATVSDTYSFVPLWKPPFLEKIVPGDRCHLNGLAMRDGQPAYVTSVSRKDYIDGWREDRRSGGCITDVTTNEVIVTGLSMPHSPRMYRDELWLTNSGSGQLGKADLKHGTFEPVAFAPGFLRGLDFFGDYAIVGSSKPRHGDAYSGLELDDALSRRKSQPHLGIFIVNVKTGAVTDWLFIDGPMRELYDVIALPGVRQPMALGFLSSEIAGSLWYDDKAFARGVAA